MERVYRSYQAVELPDWWKSTAGSWPIRRRQWTMTWFSDWSMPYGGDDLALDTSAAIPLLMRSHPAHRVARNHLGERRAVLTFHSLAETYSVLTRLPGDARLTAADAVRLLDSNFGPAIAAEACTLSELPRVLAEHDIVGGAVYDALVALAARDCRLPLATRDARALGTYRALGVELELMRSP
ncbi:MAG: type II toxin-antitoxin system VapC family toxin [Nocardioidaceae bacterium]